jgi:glyoxylase-like metal-dependent hydrolase (beta-lactamase superfamily II)
VERSGPWRLLGILIEASLSFASGVRKPPKQKNRRSPLSDAIDRWTVGNVPITRVVEFEIGGFPPGFMFAGLTEERVKSVAWLHPHYADPDGTIRYAVQAFVIVSQGRRIIVDTCVGNDKDRNNESWNHLKLPFLERLTEAGYPPESIDFVLCTHLHLDHVGWNTRWDGSKWVPTFPNARYLFGRVEWEHWSREAHSNGDRCRRECGGDLRGLISSDVKLSDHAARSIG